MSLMLNGLPPGFDDADGGPPEATYAGAREGLLPDPTVPTSAGLTPGQAGPMTFS